MVYKVSCVAGHVYVPTAGSDIERRAQAAAAGGMVQFIVEKSECEVCNWQPGIRDALDGDELREVGALPDNRKIDYRSRFKDHFQSLRLIDDGQVVFAVGIAMPGNYDFGVHKNSETIFVLDGYMIINGVKYEPGGPPCRIEAGESAVIQVRVPSSYRRTR